MPRFSYLLLPGILAIGLFFITSSFDSRDASTGTSGGEFAQNQVAYAEGIRTSLYNELGELNYTLNADRQIQLRNDTSELIRPLINIFEDSRPKWNIVADSGTISAPQQGDGDTSRQISLLGNVEIRSQDEQSTPMLVRTEALTFIPESETAETDRPVDFSMRNIVQTSIGMQADLATDEIIFLSNNEGQYAQTGN